MGQGPTKIGSSKINEPPSSTSGSGCSYANPCPVGFACNNCKCVQRCITNANCPQGTSCTPEGLCLPPTPQFPPVPQASNISASYQQYLDALPANIGNFFIKNYSNVDLVNFGIAGPSGGGTRGPLSNLNLTGDVTGTVDTPVANIDWSVSTINGIEGGIFYVYPQQYFSGDGCFQPPAPSSSIYGPGLTSSTSSSWNYTTGSLHYNTVLTFVIPQITLNMTMNHFCPNPTIKLDCVALYIPVGIDYVPGLNIPYNITLNEPNKVYPQFTNFSVSSKLLNFSCNNINVEGAIVADLLNGSKGPEVTQDILNGIQTHVGPIINNLITTFNQTVSGLLVQYSIINQYGDVLVTSAQQLLNLYLQYLQLKGTSPIVIAILATLAKGPLQNISFLLNWQPIVYSCQTQTIPSPWGCVTYQTSVVQPSVGIASQSSIRNAKTNNVNFKNVKKQNALVAGLKGQTTTFIAGQRAMTIAGLSGQRQTNIKTVAPSENVFLTREEAIPFCSNNKQGYQCTAFGCVPTPNLSNATYVYDPQTNNSADLVNCTTSCVGARACGTTTNTCLTIDQCNFNNDPASSLTLCDPTTIRVAGASCDQKCPAFNLNPDGTGVCTPALGGQFYNDPSCGQGGPNAQGSCIVNDGFTKSCYGTYPDPQSALYGTPMTADLCSSLSTQLGLAPEFIPGGKCSSTLCNPDTLTCGPANPTQGCLPFPVIPRSQGGSGSNSDQYTTWSPAFCPSVPCNPQTNPCPNGGVCVNTPSGNVCRPCTQSGVSCPAGYQCNTKTGGCQIIAGQCKMNSDCPSGQVCDTSQTPSKCVNANTTTGSCVANSFGVQTCYSQFPIPNDNNYSQGVLITNDICTYLGQQIGQQVSFRPNVQCQETCPTSTLTCASGARCTPFPGSNSSSWNAGQCP